MIHDQDRDRDREGREREGKEFALSLLASVNQVVQQQQQLVVQISELVRQQQHLTERLAYLERVLTTSQQARLQPRSAQPNVEAQAAHQFAAGFLGQVLNEAIGQHVYRGGP